MKAKIICIVAVFTFLISSAYSQKKYSKNQFTLFTYVVNIDDRVEKELQPLEGYIQYNTQKKQTRLEGMVVHTLFDVVKDVFNDSLSAFLLPPNSLGDKASYNNYGYADVSIQKAIRLSNTKYFLKIIANVENNVFDIHGKRLTDDLFRPQIRLTIEVYNKYGFMPIHVTNATVAVRQPLNPTVDFLNGMNFVESKERKSTDDTLKDLFVNATNQCLYELKYKNPK